MRPYRRIIRSGCVAAVLCLPIALLLANTYQHERPGRRIYIGTAFENASPLEWSVDSTGRVDIALLYDHERYSVNRSNGHWLFQVQAPKGTRVELVLRNFDNYWNGRLAAAITDRSPACVSVDGKTWKTVGASRIDGNRLRISVDMPADSLYVSETQPYRISDLRALVEEIKSDPLVGITTIGHTVEGRPLEMIRVGRPTAPHRVFVRARAHGYEAGGNWVAQGLIRGLLSPAGRPMLDRYCLYILPMANKDAVARGRSRFNSRGIDLNRHWDSAADPLLAPENRAVEGWLDEASRRGFLPELAIDLHNDAEGHLHLSPPGSHRGYLRDMHRLDSLLRRYTWYREGAIGGDESAGAPISSIADGLLHRYGISAAVLEFNWEWAAGLGRTPLGKDWEEFGAGLARVFDEYFKTGTSAGPATAAGRVDRGEDTLRLDSTLVGVSTVLTGLEVPWELAWGADNCIWFTEQTGRITRWDPVSGSRRQLLQLPDLYRKRLGLLSMASDMPRRPWVFVNYLFLKPDSSVWAKVVRYTYENDSLMAPKILIQWPAHIGHNGSRIAIAPDGRLMIATGDITRDSAARDRRTPNGKILRLNMDGSIPADNPYPGSPVWASGFRVPQGLVYSPAGRLYSAEHGDATDDEVNLIRKGGDYGWPVVTGYCDQPGEKKWCRLSPIVEPLRAWTPTIAPAALACYSSGAIPEWKNALLLVTLKTQSLRVLQLDRAGTRITRERVYLEKRYGRLRALCVSPAGDVYIGTSNRDWNPPENFPVGGDDRIIRIRRIGRMTAGARAAVRGVVHAKTTPGAEGAILYTSYCSSCHKAEGQGLAGSFPPLAGNPFVAGDKRALVRILLKGLSGPVQVNGAGYDQAMPSFAFLKDRDLAALLTYIRWRFNKAGGVTEKEISKERKQ
ncbi:MAG: PQQ-dependent sugar dehydrogenase [Bacteroidetes bacterium]|nr:PQQ-dependent sugar dehydrogenase [Bacteroidota bacterium]